MIVLIDNYDSFTYNLAQYLGEFTKIKVFRNDDPKLLEACDEAEALVFSPGPGWPADAGLMPLLLLQFAASKPILGVCLGHQAIAEVFGGQLRLAKQVMHGKQSQMELLVESPLFKGLASPVTVMRYHSIVIDSLSDDFVITARTLEDGEIMAIEHKELPIYGLQFHPESIGTPEGRLMLENFMKLVKERGYEKNL